MSFSLTGKTAIVTGAGRGIGRAIATRLADAGASLMLNDLERGPLSETCLALTSKGHQIRTLAGDLTKPTCPDELVKETLARFGAIDIIVNNAGYSWDGVVQKTTDEQFQAMLDIHLLVPFRMARSASEYIRA